MFVKRTIQNDFALPIFVLLSFKPVTLQLVIDEEGTEIAKLDFDNPAKCPKGELCIKVNHHADSITFHGKLTEVPKGFTATLTPNSFFVFNFGKKASTPKPDVATPTSESTASGQSSASGSSNDGDQTAPATSGSGASDNSNDEDVTVPTTSSGIRNLASTVIILFAILSPLFA